MPLCTSSVHTHARTCLIRGVFPHVLTASDLLRDVARPSVKWGTGSCPEFGGGSKAHPLAGFPWWQAEAAPGGPGEGQDGFTAPQERRSAVARGAWLGGPGAQ